jgi:two-component system cell cycle response regulator
MNMELNANILTSVLTTSDQQTVMVVDDNPTVRMIIKEELVRAGYTVIALNDGLDAISSLLQLQKPPDLIILDISMPRMDGFTCCEKIREQEAQGIFGAQKTSIPVLFVSANDTIENRRRGFQLGSMEFISKPFARNNIATVVSRMIRPQFTFAGMTALVVDDNQGLRTMVSSCLQRIGLTIVEAENGQQAYDLLMEDINRIDLAIVDYDMPLMRGDEFIHLIRQLPETEHLPLLSLSASGETDAVLHMFRAGATDYLVKPFIAEELLARVQVHLQLRRHMCRLEARNKNLFEHAVNDKLTGLYNKRYFQAAFEEMFTRAKLIKADLSLLFFDLDFFKKVNDTHGHDFGDYVLKNVGALVKTKIRRGDLAARFGGEEFVIALPNTQLDDAMIAAEKIRAFIAGHLFNDQGRQWPVTVSIGVASLLHNKPESASSLLQMADQALYMAKKLGRNRAYFQNK